MVGIKARFSRAPNGAATSVRLITTLPASTCGMPRGFAYVSGIIDPTSRLTAILGASRSQYQIPQVAGQTPSLGLTVNGVSDFPSAAINENQRQINNFAILAWQKRVGAI